MYSNIVATLPTSHCDHVMRDMGSIVERLEKMSISLEGSQIFPQLLPYFHVQKDKFPSK